MTTLSSTAASEDIIRVLTAACAAACKRRQNVVGSTDVLVELSKRFRPLAAAIGKNERAWEHNDCCGDLTAPSTDPLSDFEVLAALREARWLGRLRTGKSRDETGPRWCPCMKPVLAQTFRDTASAGVRYPRPVHLLLRILGEADCGAHRLLRQLGIDAGAVQRASINENLIRADGTVHAPAFRTLAAFGAASSPDAKALWWRLARLPGWLVSRKTGVSAMAFTIGSEAIRQTVRFDSPLTRVSHVLVAIAAVDHQRHQSGWRFTPGHDEHNDGADTLVRWGLDYPTIAGHLARLSRLSPQQQGQANPGHPWRVSDSDPLFDTTVAPVFQRASDLAAQLKHARVGSDHLLMSILTDDAADVSPLLGQSGVNVDGLQSDAARRLGITRP